MKKITLRYHIRQYPSMCGGYGRRGGLGPAQKKTNVGDIDFSISPLAGLAATIAFLAFAFAHAEGLILLRDPRGRPLRSCFSKCLPFECSSIAAGHAFQNSSHLNAPPVRQVMFFKMPAI
jgi:hypothetical protein